MDSNKAAEIMELVTQLDSSRKLETLKYFWRNSPKSARDKSIICIVNESEMPGSEQLSLIRNIDNAGKEIGYSEFLRLMQVFTAGVVYGKRAERQRRKAAIQREG